MTYTEKLLNMYILIYIKNWEGDIPCPRVLSAIFIVADNISEAVLKAKQFVIEQKSMFITDETVKLKKLTQVDSGDDLYVLYEYTSSLAGLEEFLVSRADLNKHKTH